MNFWIFKAKNKIKKVKKIWIVKIWKQRTVTLLQTINNNIYFKLTNFFIKKNLLKIYIILTNNQKVTIQKKELQIK